MKEMRTLNQVSESKKKIFFCVISIDIARLHYDGIHTQCSAIVVVKTKFSYEHFTMAFHEFFPFFFAEIYFLITKFLINGPFKSVGEVNFCNFQTISNFEKLN